MLRIHTSAAALLAAGLAVSLAHAQVHQVAYTTDDDEPFGNRNTDAGVSVNDQAVVTTSNMRVSLFNKSGSLLDTRQVGDGAPTPWPFTRVDAGIHPMFGPSRFFDPQTVYHPQSGRLWIVYSEENATGGTPDPTGATLNNISPLHIAVSKDMVSSNVLDTFNTDDWWFYTGPGPSPSNSRPAFDLQQEMNPYPEGVGSHDPYPGGPFSLVDKPHMAVDEQAAYISTTGGGPTADPIEGNVVIIPLEHGSGDSILDGDKPDPLDLTFIRTTDLPAPDFSLRHYTVQEPFDQLANAQFLVSIPEGGDDKDAIRLGGLWYDSTQPEPRWWYSQHKLTASTLADMDVDSGLEFSTNGSYRATTPDTASPGNGFNIRTGGVFFASAVLVKINNTDWRIFATTHVRPIGPTPSTPEEKWVIQWYVIDPDLANFRTASSTSTAWQPSIEAMGRLDSGEGDRIYPVIMVTQQAVAFIEYTFTSDQVWPEVRRVQLNNSYTGIVPDSETTVRPGPANEYFTTSPAHLRGWADFADAQADPANPCVFWSTHTLVHAADLTVNDRRDVWLFERLLNCNSANLNGDDSVDLYDMALFSDYYDAGARRVDMNTDGTTDAADAALYADAYDDQRP